MTWIRATNHISQTTLFKYCGYNETPTATAPIVSARPFRMALTKSHGFSCIRMRVPFALTVFSVSDDAMSALQLANRNSDCWPIPFKLARFQRIWWQFLLVVFPQMCACALDNRSMVGVSNGTWFIAAHQILFICHVQIIIVYWDYDTWLSLSKCGYCWWNFAIAESINRGRGAVGERVGRWWRCALLSVTDSVICLPMLATLRTIPMPMVMAYSCMLACRSAIYSWQDV